MAAFKQHITVSSVLGVGYTLTLAKMGLEWNHTVLAGALCAASGMLPDLDSGSGKPVRELFGVTAAVVPLLLLQRLHRTGMTPEGMILLLAGMYLAIRFGAAWLLTHITVHRGMFHSLPAAAIAAETCFLAHDSPEPIGQLALAGGVLLGYLSHLVLDEIWSVQFAQVRLNKAAGSALKLFSSSVPATLLTWVLLGLMSYMMGVRMGYVPPPHLSQPAALAESRHH